MAVSRQFYLCVQYRHNVHDMFNPVWQKDLNLQALLNQKWKKAAQLCFELNANIGMLACSQWYALRISSVFSIFSILPYYVTLACWHLQISNKCKVSMSLDLQVFGRKPKRLQWLQKEIWMWFWRRERTHVFILKQIWEGHSKGPSRVCGPRLLFVASSVAVTWMSRYSIPAVRGFGVTERVRQFERMLQFWAPVWTVFKSEGKSAALPREGRNKPCPPPHFKILICANCLQGDHFPIRLKVTVLS